MALQGPPEGLDRPAPGRRGPAARLPLARQEPDDLDALADKDGIVCIPAVRGEPPAAERLASRSLHRLRLGMVRRSLQHKLLDRGRLQAGHDPRRLAPQRFFEQHCKRFHQRPFIWHIWDGRKDGFACLVNYHKLDHKLLENLTYSYLDDWITAQAADAKRARPGPTSAWPPPRSCRRSSS